MSSPASAHASSMVATATPHAEVLGSMWSPEVGRAAIAPPSVLATSTSAFAQQQQKVSGKGHSRAKSADSCMMRASAECLTTARSPGTVGSHIENLIAQQNELMQRHLDLNERQQQHTACVRFQYRDPRELLKVVDPSARSVFEAWQNDFRAKMNIYVSQSRACQKYTSEAHNGNLMKPFLYEAQASWPWTTFYRAVATPIDGIDQVVNADSVTNKYDIDIALAALRHKHALEAQHFVIAHENACLTTIVDDIKLSRQVQLLDTELAAWTSARSTSYDAQATKHLRQEAKRFVEIVHREEMLRAESRIKQGNVTFDVLANVLRLACVTLLFLAVAFISHEVLTRLFAIIFALGCGVALIWEDLVRNCFRLLLGGTSRRARLLLAESMQLIRRASFTFFFE